MNSYIKSLDTLSEIKNNKKLLVAQKLDAINHEIKNIKQSIADEEVSLKSMYQKIRETRVSSAVIDSTKYLAESETITIVQKNIANLQQKLIAVEKEKSSLKIEVASEYKKEKLYSNLANNERKKQIEMLNKNEDSKLQEQWQSNRYLND
ncbi:hypothetical protein [Kangiella sp. HZ709]|uniref:hypothetical protein n=1 Tax=Kangiella sp. HZ709 TaxID=2666328 RepID=UPI0012B13F2E|nr:hypothetical protein [Kangiella sp. HZ709]MRX26847.1 hypothetical protein [Kangiella sp. HZ709]